VPLHINKKSESLKLIQQLRNEAHRFGISFHRSQRSRSMIRSELWEIPGIGEKTAQKLLGHFGSVKQIQSAEMAELVKLVGPAITQRLQKHFNMSTEEQEGFS